MILASLEAGSGWLPAVFQSQPMLLAAILPIALALSILLARHYKSGLRHIPGPWCSKLTSLHMGFYDLSLCRNDRILDWHRQYGPVVCIGPNEVSVATLEGTRQIYGSTLRWAKSDYFDHFKGYDERSVFATKGYSEHRARRKLISAFYQPTTIYKLPEVEERIQERSRAVLQSILTHDGQDVDAYLLTDWYAVDIITSLTLGPDFGSRSVDSHCFEREMFANLKKQQFLGPFRIRYPKAYSVLSPILGQLSPSLRYLLADDDLASWCERRVAEAVEGPRLHGTHSLLRRLLEVRGFEGAEGPLDRQYIAAEILDNINAAEATVAVTATYLIWRLAAKPVWQGKIRQELAALPVQEGGAFAFADIEARVPSLEACLREVYRLHPASSGRAERVVPKGGHVLSGMYLPEGTIVTNSVSALHRDETLFPDPDAFRPERWLEDVVKPATLKLREAQLIPFGHGSRICLGKALATMEIKVLVASLLTRHEIALAPSTTNESMWQCSTHDAVPRALSCFVRFQRVAR